MKYILLISSLIQLLDFSVSAHDALENYYKSIMVLEVYHEKFTTHLRNEHLQLSLGPHSFDYSITTLLLQEDEKTVPDLIMRQEDIRWNHLYLSATPLEPLTLAQNFANGFAWFSAFREMLNFRVGALYYKKKNRDDLSKNCYRMAAYLTMFQLILKQDRIFEFGNIMDDYIRENTFSLVPQYFKPDKDSNSGRDALATAKNMELLSKVTEVLNEIVDYRTVRRQYPVTPSDPWIYQTNEDREKTRKSVVQLVKEELALDFYLREAPKKEAKAAGLSEKLRGLELEEAPFEISVGKDVEAAEQSSTEQRSAENPIEASDWKQEAFSSSVPEETIPTKKEPSEEEKEREWLTHSDSLKTIDEKYDNNLEEDNDVFYHKRLWKELLAIYGDALVQVTEYFHFAIAGSSYKSTVENWTNSYEDYVPNMDESVAVWEKAEELFGVAKADYQPEKSSGGKEFKSHPVAILEMIETIRFTHRNKNAVIDETRIRSKWTLQYVDPRDASADFKVV